MRRTVRIALVLALAAAGVLVGTGTASAAVGLSGTLLPDDLTLTVGNTSNVVLTVQNTNTPPNQADALTVTSLQIAPSCGAQPVPPNPCSVPDVGVLSVLSAVGIPGTPCHDIGFTAGVPDANGVITLTPTNTVLLQPPGSGSNLDRCAIDVTYTVERMPSIDAQPGLPGVQTFMSARGVAQNGGGLIATTQPFVMLQILPRPALQAPADFDGDLDTDIAVYRPSNGRWYIHTPSSVLPLGLATDHPVPADVHPDGAGAERQVYRPSSGKWYAEGQPILPFGAPGDIPVPGNYDNVTALNDERAVFRPSTGRWYIEGRPGPTALGTNGDVPVPADYDGDGDTDLAVFRPSSNRWYLETVGGSVTSVAFGTAGDIPVPGDYDDDGVADIAVYRPATGRWYVEGIGGSVPFGTVGDIPVPGDYDADGQTERAVFRPSSGRWYIEGVGGSTPFGTGADVPLALPYAVYRHYIGS